MSKALNLRVQHKQSIGLASVFNCRTLTEIGDLVAHQVWTAFRIQDGPKTTFERLS